MIVLWRKVSNSSRDMYYQSVRRVHQARRTPYLIIIQFEIVSKFIRFIQYFVLLCPRVSIASAKLLLDFNSFYHILLNVSVISVERKKKHNLYFNIHNHFINYSFSCV